MSLRPALRQTVSSPGETPSHSTPNTVSPSPSPSFSALPQTTSSSRVSVQLPDRPRSTQYDSTIHLPSAMSQSGSAGFPRTRTNSSGQGPNDGKYRRKVGFEAFEAGPAALFAFTCQAKSEGYKRSRNTRVFAVAVSPDESGEDALDWLMSELVEDGDEVVAIRVIELDEERQSHEAQDELREDAQRLLRTILEKNNEADDRRISVIVEFVAGKVTEILLKMIALYRPDSLVVGTKGIRSKFQTWGRALGAPGMGSVSRFAVSHSPVPVIVVRPERKVKKTLAKRQNDPKRGQYAAIVGPDGLALSRSRSRGSTGAVSDRGE
ncbi:universal stress protein [Kwoniella mangroviensis CBS 8886]|nr:universal stress protein [Kwoniella mangroviensis CBS 8507]OCF67015.1 universal stress protein [Kwoniella mangroviensis CBS 8507]OCF77991.1 universal stress protein [Kwoniella mangroviensis CBS 8886]